MVLCIKSITKELLVWYSAEQYFAKGESHSDSGTDVDIHLLVRSRGSFITSFKALTRYVSKSSKNN